MFQLTKEGKIIADIIDEDPDKEHLFSSLADWELTPLQHICLNWLRGNLGPRLMERAIEAEVVNPCIPKALKDLVKKGLVEEV